MSYLNNFHYRITGPEGGRRWVFLHGLMGYLNNWGSIVKGLEPTEQCLVFDQRGHGQSIKPAQGYSPQDYAEDLHKITEELGWKKFILVGHSMGGRNALCFAQTYPEKILKLVIEDIGPESSLEGHLYYEKLLASIPTPFASKAQAREFFEQKFQSAFQTKEDPKVLSAFLLANLQETQGGVVDWKFSSSAMVESARLGRRQDAWDWIRDLKVPTLWIRGEKSKELSPESLEKILSLNHLIQGVVIPQAGHWVHSENKEAFLKAIKSFTGLSDKL